MPRGHAVAFGDHGEERATEKSTIQRRACDSKAARNAGERNRTVRKAHDRLNNVRLAAACAYHSERAYLHRS
jgi:hypothetical protein